MGAFLPRFEAAEADYSHRSSSKFRNAWCCTCNLSYAIMALCSHDVAPQWTAVFKMFYFYHCIIEEHVHLKDLKMCAVNGFIHSFTL
jgi:hypothetical protein